MAENNKKLENIVILIFVVVAIIFSSYSLFPDSDDNITIEPKKTKYDVYTDDVNILEQQVSKATNAGDGKSLEDLYNRLIDVHTQVNNTPKVIHSRERLAYTYSSESKLKHSMEQYNQIALIHMQEKNYELAATNYQKIIDLADKTDEPTKIKAIAYHNLGNTYFAANDTRKAVDNFYQSFGLNSQLGNEQHMVETVKILVPLLISVKKLELAEDLQLTSLNINIKNKNESNIVMDYIGLGEVYTENQDGENGCRAFAEANKLAMKLGKKFVGDLDNTVQVINERALSTGCKGDLSL
jgi:tetratricopeptide (TPR) repeat protein